MGNFADCWGKHAAGLSDLDRQSVESLIAEHKRGGASELDAARRAVQAHFDEAHAQLQSIYKQTGVEPKSEPVPEAQKETTPPKSAETPITGVHAAALEQRPIVTPPPGEVVGWEDNTANGHEWLDKGGDPQTIINKFSQSGAVTPQDMGRMRAALERLQQATNVARDALRKDPTNPELIRVANEATTTEQNFTDAYKPMHTFASANLASLKGQPPFTDDMATSYTALERRFKENMGHDFTPEESAKAEKLTEKATKDEQNYKDQTSDFYKKTDEAFKKASGPNRVPTIQELAKALTDVLEEVC